MYSTENDEWWIAAEWINALREREMCAKESFCRHSIFGKMNPVHCVHSDAIIIYTGMNAN